MPWNWELPQWPHFTCDFDQIAHLEKQFLLSIGKAQAFISSLNSEDYSRFVVEILSDEGIKSSKIEGEVLDRESLQSSIKKHFGLEADHKSISNKESQMAELLLDIYETYDKALTHKQIWHWHTRLFDKHSSIDECGKYRTHVEPMQIVSNRYGVSKVYFEAPPSERISQEMSAFIQWFNQSKNSMSILGRAAIAHVYFESIHPFEDGNGRIGRALVEKVLSQGVGKPVLVTVSKVLEKRKKQYYAALQKCNHTLQVQDWILFFSEIILQAQEESMSLLYFLIGKSKMLTELKGRINARQEKVLLRMFAAGPSGFKGGLSAENYITIAKTSTATATRDLTDLVDKGALVKTGKVRHTRYRLNL